MKIIIDECVPSIVKRGLPLRQILTVQDMGWAGIKNGQLLKLVMTGGFEVFITSDKNLRYQQNLLEHDLAFVILPSNQVPIVKGLLTEIDRVLNSIQPKELVEL